MIVRKWLNCVNEKSVKLKFGWNCETKLNIMWNVYEKKRFFLYTFRLVESHWKKIANFEELLSDYSWMNITNASSLGLRYIWRIFRYGINEWQIFFNRIWNHKALCGFWYQKFSEFRSSPKASAHSIKLSCFFVCLLGSTSFLLTICGILMRFSLIKEQ